MGNAMSDDEADGEVDGEVDEVDETLPEDAINKELQILEAQLQMLASGGTVFAAAAAAAGNEPGGEPAANQGVTQGNATDLPSQHKREGRSRVWKAFDRATNRCTLPHPSGESGRVCNSLPPSGTGTSGHIRHLEAEHAADWLHIKITGEKKSSTQMIADALAAKVDVSKPPLGTNESNELDRLAARWVAKCGRPIAITEDNELREYIARSSFARHAFVTTCQQMTLFVATSNSLEPRARASHATSLCAAWHQASRSPSRVTCGLKMAWASLAFMRTACPSSRWRRHSSP
jgi:hypothetical protein